MVTDHHDVHPLPNDHNVNFVSTKFNNFSNSGAVKAIRPMNVSLLQYLLSQSNSKRATNCVSSSISKADANCIKFRRPQNVKVFI